MRATVIANEADDDAGVVGEHLRDRGFALSVAHREHHGSWAEPIETDLLVLLGSDWSVYWPDVAAAVAAEVAVVRAAHQRGVPVFAVCFGAQMVSHALGGGVERAERPEIGWFEISSSHPAIDPGPWFQWHTDRFVVPPGFELLAESAVGPQAMRAGRTLAVQFHPEVTAPIVRRWASDAGTAELAGHGLAPDLVLDTASGHFVRQEARCRDLLDWFLDTVGEGGST